MDNDLSDDLVFDDEDDDDENIYILFDYIPYYLTSEVYFKERNSRLFRGSL